MKTLDDLTAPVAVTRQLLERDLQGQCVDWMRRRDYWARKFSSQSQRSVPDYLFSHRGAEHTGQIAFYCEFKKPGTKPKFLPRYNVWVMSTEAQYEEQVAMRCAGWAGFECDDFEKFKTWVLGYESCVC